LERLECVVIGAGVIGLVVAWVLARSGREVTILDAEATFGDILFRKIFTDPLPPLVGQTHYACDFTNHRTQLNKFQMGSNEDFD